MWQLDILTSFSSTFCLPDSRIHSRVVFGLMFHQSVPQCLIFTLITSVRVQLSTDWAPAPLIHTLRLLERQEGGPPVYRDHWEHRNWLRGDSLIKMRVCHWTRGQAGRAHCRVLFRRNRVGSGGGRGGGGYSGQSGICRQYPVSKKFRFYWMTYPLISSHGQTVKLEHFC